MSAVAFPIEAFAEKGVPGGFAEAQLESEEVKAAAAFAVKAQKKSLEQRARDREDVKLELVCILKAEQQVVAGMNYRLRLNVKLNGVEKTADVVVWWQAWRKPEPYEVTSWEWK